MKKNIKTLYQKDKKGNIRFWSVWTEKNEVITEFGILGEEFKSTVSKYKVEAKNIGQKNERTPNQQAIFEANSLYEKKLRSKYETSIKDAKKEKLLPMLAFDGKKENKKKYIKFPAYIQRKYNGLRCLSEKKKNKISLISRGNKRYKVNHIEEFLLKHLDNKNVLDGELYCHGYSLQELNSLVKKWNPKTSINLEFIVYDYPIIDGDKTLSQEDRLEKLTALIDSFPSNTIIKLAETYEVNSWEEILKYEKMFIQEGYEGAIVRNKNGIYDFANRSNDLLKIKTFQDAEFEVVNFDIEYFNKNDKKMEAVVWLCKNDIPSPDGSVKIFEVRPKGTFIERQKLLENAKKYIGKKLTVKFFERSKDKVPLHATGMGFRLEEDLPVE